MKKILFFVLAIVCLWACEKTPVEIAVTSVSLSQSTAEMIEGETVLLIATVLPSDATDKIIIWASSKQSVATISNTGLVTAIAEGTSTITASAGGKSATCTVTVSKKVIEVSSVKLNKESLELVEGDSETLIATVLPENATDKIVTWESSDPSVASVDQNGTVTAVAEGQAGITAMIGDKGSFCEVVVSKKVIAVESIELNKTELTLYEGETEALTATIKPDDATDKTIYWESSNKDVAFIDESGEVSAIKEGEAIITAKAGEKTATCHVMIERDRSNDAISFEDENLKLILVDAYDKNNDGELSYKEAADVKSWNWSASFFQSQNITSFDEFQYFTGLTKVSFWQFSEWTIKSIILPKSITTIEWSAFENCPNLQSITIQEGVTSIGDKAFYNCDSLTSIIIPDGVTSLGNYVFASCANLTTVSLPESLTTLGGGVFSGCIKLTSAIIPDKVTLLYQEVFAGCESLSYIKLPSNLEQIGSNCFVQCKSLSSISIPNSVWVICNRAFALSGLTSITLPAHVQLQSYAFGECRNLAFIEFPPEGVGIGESAFMHCTSLTSVSIPKGSGIGKQAFCGCSGLTSISLPNNDSDWNIGDSAFEHCDGLTSVIIPESVTGIGDKAFYGCKNLKSVSLPNNLKWVGSQAFAYCDLDSIILPETVTEIKTQAFIVNNNMTSVTLLAEQVPKGDNN